VPENAARVELLLTALFLGDASDGDGLIDRAAAEWIGEWLGLQPVEHFGRESLRHLVAVQLAPRDAVAYDLNNSIPRWRLVDDYLRQRLSVRDHDRREIARTVAVILDRGTAGRGGFLMSSEWATECAVCRLPFRTIPASVTTRDPFKPTWLAPTELCRPEVDHIVPVSGLGRHTHENVQIICRACNMAKGSGLVIDPDLEVRFAGSAVGNVPRVHLFRLLQWLIGRKSAVCGNCGAREGELTFRLVHPHASLTRANLDLRCYACAGATDR
jgi:5-methylcytosine-specific restriction endonuclease McrA